MKQEKNLTIVTIKIKTIIILAVILITLIAFATVLKLTNLTKMNLIEASKQINISKEISSTINMVSNQEDKDANTVKVANENNLSILRLNRAGMLPDFNLNIKEYYIIVGEEVSSAINVALNQEDTNANIVANENNLSILRLNRAGMLPDFNPNIKEYYIIVGEEINNLEVTAVPENEDDKVIIEGNDNLKNGLNTITVRVTSKNNISEEYKIYVTKTSNREEANASLENLAVEGYTLSPNFQNQVLNYKIEVNENIDKLNILAIPENYDAKVEIKENASINLNSQKENIVTVIVTAPNKITFRKYEIVVSKKVQESINNSENNEDDNNLNINEQDNINNNEISIERLSNYKEIELSQKQKLEIIIKQNSITILGILVSIAVLGIVVILLYRKKKQK